MATTGKLISRGMSITSICGYTSTLRFFYIKHTPTFWFIKTCRSSTQECASLRYAALHGHLNIVVLLLADGRVDVNAHDGFALKWAVRYGHVKVARVLRHHSDIDMDKVSKYGICGSRSIGSDRHIRCLEDGVWWFAII